MTCSHGFAASKKEDPPMSKKQAPSVRLLNELMRTRDFQALLDLARPTFGNPMILSNGSYSVIAITDEPDIHDPRWLEGSMRPTAALWTPAARCWTRQTVLPFPCCARHWPWATIFWAT